MTATTKPDVSQALRQGMYSWSPGCEAGKECCHETMTVFVPMTITRAKGTGTNDKDVYLADTTTLLESIEDVFDVTPDQVGSV